MLSNDGIKFLDLHLVRHGSLVLAGRVVMTCASRGNQLNLFSHDLDLLTFGSKIPDNLFNAQLIDDAHSFCRNAELHKPVFAFEPKTMVVNIGQKSPFRLVVRVRHIVTANWTFASYLTFSGHAALPYLSVTCKARPYIGRY